MGTMTQTLHNHTTIVTNPKQPMRVCFSFAAYSKNLIDHLKTTTNIPIQEGLSDTEFAYVESSHRFTFPPDLRSILREGLPVGPGFPNWRSSSHQQLEILMNLPKLCICKEISTSNLWFETWGVRPDVLDEALDMANNFLMRVPVLIPIYKNFYIASTPNLAGNPVFYVDGSHVKLSSFDLTGFFLKAELWHASVEMLRRSNAGPAWAATSARRIEFWSEMAGRELGWCTRGWWRGKLGVCMEEVYWRLRDGGWKEEEVREMMMMVMDGGDDDCVNKEIMRDQLKVLSLRLLDGGWSREDVVYSLGCCNYSHDHHAHGTEKITTNNGGVLEADNKPFLGFHTQNSVYKLFLDQADDQETFDS